MHILIITHAKFEQPGLITEWADENEHTLSIIAPYRGEAFPALNTFDFLIIMGGPQSPTDLIRFPYLAAEIAFIQQVLQAQKPILGICLGAQLIAEARGAKTLPSPHKEVGAFPIHFTAAAKADPIFKTFPATLTVMHWHNDMPGLPADAVVLAESPGCPRQIMRFNKYTYGLQCHLEMTTELIQGMIWHCAADLAPSTYTQTAEAMLHVDLATMHTAFKTLLNALSEFS